MSEMIRPSAEKLKALQLAMEKIDKAHGKGTVMKLGDDKIENVSVIKTGSLGLDLALGIGGLPRGRIIEIYGPESSGKTTLALHVVAEAQKTGIMGILTGMFDLTATGITAAIVFTFIFIARAAANAAKVLLAFIYIPPNRTVRL